MFAGGAVAEAAVAWGWVRSSGKTLSPAPPGAVVSPLKKSAPHCSWAAAVRPRGRRKGRLCPHLTVAAHVHPAPRPLPRALEKSASSWHAARIDSEHCHSLGALRSAPVSGPPHGRHQIPALTVLSRPGTVGYSEARTSRSFSWLHRSVSIRQKRPFPLNLLCTCCLSLR